MINASESFAVTMGINEPDTYIVQLVWERREGTSSKALGGEIGYLPKQV
jgi:hypothetical protein